MPLEIDRSEEVRVRIRWADGHETVYSARDLRIACPCASCVDETTGERILEPAGVPDDIRITAARLVGRYAVELTFSDGHSLGFYTFEGLRAGCSCPECAG